MSSDEVDKAIQRNIPWAKLPEELKIILGNSQREYDKRVLDFSIKNQIRYKGSIVRHVKRNEEEYYDQLLNYSRTRLMLFPYHLNDIIVRGLRVTPFSYYVKMMEEIMAAEKSYDSLPNFTAADAVRLLGIGRNQYIDLMNQNRSFRKLFRRTKSLRDILPQKPANVPIEPWYLLCDGCIMEHDIKLLTPDEKETIDKLVDNGPTPCGTIDKKIVERLYHKGLVYLDVPISDDDYVYVPTLDGFVMNRVQGDFFETLLYKVFVTLDGQTSPKELADMIEIDEQSVKNAISVFCRLGFARKRVTGVENMNLHPSWLETTASTLTSPTTDTPMPLSSDLADLSSSLSAEDEDDLVSELEKALKEEQKQENGSIKSGAGQIVPENLITPVESASKRIAFIFDSTLTAFLMMGNLSTSLKNHAVTLFEVGKLADEALNSFVEELQNVNFFVEGEAQRYSEHARTLLNTINSLRTSNELDLIRGESLLSLDPNARVKVLQKSYKLLVSMSPISAEACTLPISNLPYYGTPCVELTSYWLRLMLYDQVKNGPPSMLLPMGTRVHRIPELFWKYERVVLSTGIHEPVILSIDTCLWTLNDMLLSSPVLVQAYSNTIDDSEIINVPFPFQETDTADELHFVHHPAIKELRQKLQLDHLCGYVVLLKQPKPEDKNTRKLWDEFLARADKEKEDSEERSLKSPEPEGDEDDSEREVQSLNRYGSPAFGHSSLNSNISKDPRKISFTRFKLNKDEYLDDFVLLDCIFGIPLFSEQLNEEICRRVHNSNLVANEHYSDVKFSVHNIVELSQEFVKNHRSPGYKSPFPIEINQIPYPTDIVVFDSKVVKILQDLF